MVLQERCRKDPLSYEQEFISQRLHFDALLSSACLRPSDPSPRLAEVAGFMGSVAHCYPKHGSAVAPPIATFLTESGPAMDPHLRRSLVRLLGLMRAKGSADPNVIIPLFFRLLACNDKALRRMLHGHIVADIKKINTNGHSSTKSLQSFLFSMVEDPSQVLVKRSLHVLVDLFRKKIWNNAKCTNMIATACFHDAVPVAIIATKFILDSESKEEIDDSDDDSDDESRAMSKRSRDGQKAADLWKTFNMTGKKSSKKKKKMERVISRLTTVKGPSSANAVSETNPGHPSFEAMMLLNDPQDFAERLFTDLQTKRKKESYEHRLIFINLLSRLVGTHQLILFNLYPFLQRYLQPAQPEVTRVLAYLTQACHEMVTPDVLHPILRGLADSFVSERSSPPSVAAGLNTIRAICSRVPLAILDKENEDKAEDEQEAPLLLDLVQYKSSKDKGIAMAARSLVGLYREVHPRLLHKRDRGRAGAEAVQKGDAPLAKPFGEHMYATGVEGVELLAEKDSEDEEDEEGICEDDSEGEDKTEDVDDESVNDNEQPEVDEGSKDEEVPSDVEDVDSCDEKEGEESKGEKRKRRDETELLTNEDFAKIRRKRAANTLGESMRTVHTGDAVDPYDLQGPIKRERKNHAERMESVLSGREGREKFGSRKGLNKGGGSTNKQKLKSKSNAMVIHKRRKKSKMSRRDRQLGKRRKKDYK